MVDVVGASYLFAEQRHTPRNRSGSNSGDTGQVVSVS